MRERKCITCPLTDRITGIDLDRTRVGIVIEACDRYDPRSAIACNRECARRMDRAERAEGDDRRERVLVVFSGRDRRSESVARVLAETFVADGLDVELGNADTGAAPPADYDAVVIGFGVHATSVNDYIACHRDALAALPAFVFFVTHELVAPDTDELLRALNRRTRWEPTGAATFRTPHVKHGAFCGWLARFRDRSRASLPRVDWAIPVRAWALQIADAVPAAADS